MMRNKALSIAKGSVIVISIGLSVFALSEYEKVDRILTIVNSSIIGLQNEITAVREISVVPPAPKISPVLSDVNDDNYFVEQPKTVIGKRLYANEFQRQLSDYFFLYNTVHTKEGIVMFLPDMSIQKILIPDIVLRKFGKPYADLLNPIGAHDNSIAISFQKEHAVGPTFDNMSLITALPEFHFNILMAYSDTLPTSTSVDCSGGTYTADIQQAAAFLFAGSVNTLADAVPKDVCRYVQYSPHLTDEVGNTTTIRAYYVNWNLLAKEQPTSTLMYMQMDQFILVQKDGSPITDYIADTLRDRYMVIDARIVYPHFGGDIYDKKNIFKKGEREYDIVHTDTKFLADVQEKIVKSLSLLSPCDYACAY